MGISQKETRPTRILTEPSMSTNHCQLASPRTPDMLVRMAAASRPEMTLEMVFPACQMPMRSGLSRLVYHDDVMSETAGTKGPSVTPTRKRHSMKPHAEFSAVMQMVTAGHASMAHGSRIRGLPLARITLAGTCEMMYPT